MKRLFLIILVVAGLHCWAQPYLDPLNSRFLGSPKTGLSGTNQENTRLQYVSAGTLLPLLKHSRDVFFASPAFEEWTVTRGTSIKLRGIQLPLGYLKTMQGGKWTVLTTFFSRLNYAVPGGIANSYQYGGAVIVSKKWTESLVFKLGLYYNKEFFGNFFMPLAGVDWRISVADKLFGILPGNLTYEHQWSHHFYSGGVFRAITNSYRLKASDTVLTGCKPQQYLRIDDNQLGVYLDYYLTKHLVINLELGHSLFRKVRVGVGGEEPVALPCTDSFFGKAGIAYRLRQ